MVVGGALVAVAAWLSFLVPIRTTTRVDDRKGYYTEYSDHITVWGVTISQSIKGYEYETDKSSPSVEGYGSGPVKDQLPHGEWTGGERRLGGEWKINTEWYWQGKSVSKEEWERRNRERK